MGLGTEGGGVADAGRLQARGKRDGIAVQVQDEGGEHIATRSAETELGGPEERGRRLRGVEFAVDDLVPHRRPADFAAQLHFHPMAGKQPQLLRGDQGRGVGQGNKSQPETARAPPNG